ncbi:MAG: hypothetical protein COT73_09805 [Bdellovibrio sp. CG10_big_fil_rev_8_21_14_0_10_47_8]|nr:MAG: hypothetical protein COT73_09805 [Bdellovibrio sp. CG10_big_fil_rev_8_21_14_0_10_47_8]
MKMTFLLLMGLTTLASLGIVSVAQAGSLCANTHLQSGLAKSLEDWRTSITHQEQTLAATSIERELWIKDAKKAMEDFIFVVQDTPEMIFAQAEGIQARSPNVAITNAAKNTIPLNYTNLPGEQGYHYDQVPHIEVSNLGPSGVLTGTLLLPVSAHYGLLPKSKGWSTTDTYSIYLESKNGQRLATLAQDVRSLDYITAQEISLPLTVGETVRLTYYRSGSGGPPGYPDGRILEITWDGK